MTRQSIILLAALVIAACSPPGIPTDDSTTDSSSDSGSDESSDSSDTTVGDGDGDSDVDMFDECQDHPGALGCPCGGGDCVTGLVCNGVGCTPCPQGSPGCPCGDGRYCETDLCLSSSSWSVCVPNEGPILCVAGECPGDMICGEPGLQYCAWPAP